MSLPRIAIVGLGEVGTILADDLLAAGHDRISVYDLRFDDPVSAPSLVLRARPRLAGATSAAAAVAGAELVLSAVTAGNDVAAARAAAPGLAPGAWFVDLNSVAPQTRVEAAQLTQASGALYVEAAVMSPVPPRRIGVPILLGGPHAAAFLPLAQALGFNGARLFAGDLGRASAAKMCRSVVVKGMEALLGEALLAARHYRVEDEVISSLADLLPDPDWVERARYLISRSLAHGTRRAEEMVEVARTVKGAGVEPSMSEATERRQRWAARFGPAQDLALVAMLDEIHARMARPLA